jgi:uncharacterized protein (TIGR00661 family)
MQKFNNKRILIAPLDWGLGHTTRCVTIIKFFLDKGFVVIVACNPTQKSLLRQEFSNIQFLGLKGYGITYSNNKNGLPFKLVAQLPKIVTRIFTEHRCLQKMIDKYSIDLVISDNRYGFYSSKVPSIFITHQLTIKAPFVWLETLLQRINYSYINRFSQCWVPDFAGNKNIAGALSHPKSLPTIPVHYIGLLARFKRVENAPIRYEYFIILSGPEPQRTIFEDIILQQLPTLKDACLLVRGKLNAPPITTLLPNVTIKNHLNGIDLQEAINASAFVVTRSGYTSVMELLALQKKSILVPTPGQTEQEYLGKQLMHHNWAYCIDQKDFDLTEATTIAKEFAYHLPTFDDGSLNSHLDNILASVFQ